MPYPLIDGGFICGGGWGGLLGTGHIMLINNILVHALFCQCYYSSAIVVAQSHRHATATHVPLLTTMGSQ